MENGVKDDESIGRLHELRSDVEPLLGSVVAVDRHVTIILRGDLSQGGLCSAHDKTFDEMEGAAAK
jgi:hypothetical protein